MGVKSREKTSACRSTGKGQKKETEKDGDHEQESDERQEDEAGGHIS